MTEQSVDSSAVAAEGYLGLYGLAREPFVGEMLPSFFYPGATREQRLNLLLHLVPLGEILLIIGVPGVGKTTLLEQFLAKGKESWRICRLDASGGIDSNQLLQQLVQAFAPEVQGQTDRAEMERLLISQLQLLRKSTQQPMLLIDNAQHIAESGFRALSKYLVVESEEEKLFGVVLFSELEIEEKLNNPALHTLRGQIKHTFELPLLSEEETLQYLDHRMQAAGLQGNSPFTGAVNKAIFGTSKGLPAKVNELAQAVMQNKRHSASPAPAAAVDEAPTAEPVKGKSRRLSLSFIWPFLVAGVLASVLLFQDEINSLFNPPDTETPVAENSEAPLPTIDVEVSAPVHQVEGNVERKLPESETAVAETASDVEVTLADSISKDVIEPEAETAPEKIEAAVEPQTETLPVAELVLEAPVKQVAMGEPLIKEAPTKELPRVAVAIPSEAAKSDWVRAQRSQDYTLQIVAQEQPEKREAFIARFDLDSDVERFSTDKKGRRWYVAAIGVYESRTAALEASRQLPEGVVPWVRSFASIQKELWQEKSAVGEIKRTAITPATTQPKMTEDERWVMARPSDHFVLQLVAFEKASTTREFLVSHRLLDSAKQVRLINRGRIWFVAVYGDAADRPAALQLADNLEQNKGVRRPWARSFGSLQQAMRKFQQK